MRDIGGVAECPEYVCSMGFGTELYPWGYGINDNDPFGREDLFRLGQGLCVRLELWKRGVVDLLVPNAYGGRSGGMLGPDSELYKELRAKGVKSEKRYRLLPIGERRHLLPGRFISGHWSASCLFWECS